MRHIPIKVADKSSFIPSVGRLWNLHTLIVSYSFSSGPILLADFWKMPQLRDMQFIDDCECLPDPPNGDGQDGDGVVIMKNLHTLKGIRNFKCSEGVVKRILNIKRLKLEYDGDDEEDEDDVYFVGNMKYLCGLQFLSVAFYRPSSITSMKKMTFPHSLKKLSLKMSSEFEWNDKLEKIGLLPLLEKLKLEWGCFGRGKWEIAQGQFPCLKYLELDICQGLVNWTVSEEDSSILPRLEHLSLRRLFKLEKFLLELGNVDTLKSIKLIDCGEEAVRSVKEMFDEQVELQGGEEQLSFHVDVTVGKKQQHLLSLASPKFSTFSNLS